MKPTLGPYASRRKTYSPPAEGRIAASSAYVIAPHARMTAPTIQARDTRRGDPIDRIISEGTRNIALPTILPTTTAAA
jgi:hypothetical protein